MLLISANYQLLDKKTRSPNTPKKPKIFPDPNYPSEEFEKVPCNGNRFHGMDLLPSFYPIA